MSFQFKPIIALQQLQIEYEMKWEKNGTVEDFSYPSFSIHSRFHFNFIIRTFQKSIFFSFEQISQFKMKIFIFPFTFWNVLKLYHPSQHLTLFGIVLIDSGVCYRDMDRHSREFWVNAKMKLL